MGIIQKTFKSSESFDQFLGRYLDFYVQSVNQLKSQDFTPFMEALRKCHEQKKKVIVFGNGGSAANATHLSTGLSYITRSWENPLKSISLSADPILLTSLGNDFSFEDVFFRQLQIHLEPGDLVLALSVSGKSKNVLAGVRFAKERGNFVIGFTGSDGGELKKHADFCLHVASDETLFGVTEDIHMVFGHALTYYLEHLFQNTSE